MKMETVKIRKEELLEALKKNRATHRKIFEEAQEGYREEAIKLLDKALDDARKGKEIKTFIQLQAPIDQTKDYDRAIRMIEMSVEDVIEIDEKDFACYIMDDWDWKRQFLTTNAFYSKTLKA
jgi:DNA polymerase II small subunit/DNA polymerase delta subunit B